MTILTPSLISPTTSKLFAYLPFSNQKGTHVQQTHNKSSELPTYITIVMQKDGTPTTKCLNPPTSSRSTISSRRRRCSFSSSTHSLCSPPKQRRLMISSLIPRFPRRNSSQLVVDQQNHHLTLQQDTIIPIITTTATIDSLEMIKKRQILFLPSELIIKILLSLDCKSLLRLSQTCKQFYKVCHKQHHYLWQSLFQNEHNPKLLKQLPSIPFYDLYKNHHELNKRWKQGKVKTRYLTGHDDSVYCLVWVGNNKIVSGSRDRSIKLWDLSFSTNNNKKSTASTGLVSTKTHHEGSVLCLRVSTDLSFLVSGSSDTTCLVWSLPDLLPQKRLMGHSGGVLDVCVIGDTIISSSRDATIRVWNRITGIEIRRLVGHAGPVNALGSFDGRVVSASGDSTLKLWDIESGDCLKTFSGHTRGLACVRFDGQFIYSGGQDNKLKVWDVNSGKCVSTLSGHSDLIRTIDSFEDKAVSGSYDRTLRVWNAKENKCLLSFQSGHSSWIFNCLLSRTKIISAGQDKRIMVLDFGYDLITME